MTERKNGWMVWSMAAGLTSTALVINGCSTTKGAAGEARAEAHASYNANRAKLGVQQARQDFEVGNLDSALYNINGTITLQPDVGEYYVLRGRILIELNQLDSARTSLLQAVELSPHLPEPHYYLGLVYQRWSNNEQALAEYTKALEMDPENENFMLATVEMQITMRQLDQAQALLNSKRAQFSNNASLRRCEGHIALLRGEPAVAAEQFHKALLLMPEDMSLVEMLAMAHLKAGNTTKAEFYLDQLLKDPEYAKRLDLQHLRAMCLVAENELVEARSIYLKLVSKDASNPQYWFELGSVAIEIGDMGRVRQVVSRALTVWPERYEGYLLRGMMNERQGNVSAAIEDYRRSCKLNPSHERSYVLLGLALAASGRDQEAEDAFGIARMLNPRSIVNNERGTVANVETDR